MIAIDDWMLSLPPRLSLVASTTNHSVSLGKSDTAAKVMSCGSPRAPREGGGGGAEIKPEAGRRAVAFIRRGTRT